MPNWCYNELRFKTEEDCRKVAQLMKSENSPFDFNNVIPMPKYMAKIPGSGAESHTRALAYAFSKGKTMTEPEMKTAIKKAYPQIKEVDHTPKINSFFQEEREPYVLSNDDVVTLTRYANYTDYQKEIANYRPFSKNAVQTYDEYAELVKRAFFETGCLDWYSWSNAHWGTKWNASEPTVDIHEKYIYWETAWGPTPQIVAAIHSKTNLPMHYIYTEEQITAFAGEMVFSHQETKDHYTEDPKECAQLAAYMDVIDTENYRLTSDGVAVEREWDGKAWETAEEITPKAELEEKFLSL